MNVCPNKNKIMRGQWNFWYGQKRAIEVHVQFRHVHGSNADFKLFGLVWFDVCRNSLNIQAHGMLLCIQIHIIIILKIPNQQNENRSYMYTFVLWWERVHIARRSFQIYVQIINWNLFRVYGYEFMLWFFLVQDICKFIRNSSVYAKKSADKIPFTRLEKWLRTSNVSKCVFRWVGIMD